MTTVVSIGEFSRLTHLTVKALRHYHDVGVLVPTEVDEHTGYRRYGLDQVADAHLIRRLRDLDMPLDRVRAVVSANDPDERQQALLAHLDHMERELARTRDVVASLRELLESPVRRPDVGVRAIPPVVALSIRGEVERNEIESWSQASFERLAAAVAESGARPAGPSGSLFSAGFFEAAHGEVVAFVGIERPPRRTPSGCAATTIAGGRFASATHVGPYADLDRTYGAVGGWVATHLSADAGPIREHYLVGPDATDDPTAFRTEVLWPLGSG